MLSVNQSKHFYIEK